MLCRVLIQYEQPAYMPLLAMLDASLNSTAPIAQGVGFGGGYRALRGALSCCRSGVCQRGVVCLLLLLNGVAFAVAYPLPHDRMMLYPQLGLLCCVTVGRGECGNGV